MNGKHTKGNEYQASRRLLLVQVLAGLAQWIDIFLIFSIPAFLWKSSPAEIAFLAACFGIPGLIFGPFVGAFMDRADPKKFMMFGIHARTILSVFIAFAPGYWFFAAAVLMKGLANLCYWPSSFILTNHIIREDERIRYYSSLSACDQISKITTPLIAGALAIIMNSQMTFLAGALLTLVASSIIPVLLLSVRTDSRPPGRCENFSTTLSLAFSPPDTKPRSGSHEYPGNRNFVSTSGL